MIGDFSTSELIMELYRRTDGSSDTQDEAIDLLRERDHDFDHLDNHGHEYSGQVQTLLQIILARGF